MDVYGGGHSMQHSQPQLSSRERTSFAQSILSTPSRIDRPTQQPYRDLVDHALRAAGQLPMFHHLQELLQQQRDRVLWFHSGEWEGESILSSQFHHGAVSGWWKVKGDGVNSVVVATAGVIWATVMEGWWSYPSSLSSVCGFVPVHLSNWNHCTVSLVLCFYPGLYHGIVSYRLSQWVIMVWIKIFP